MDQFVKGDKVTVTKDGDNLIAGKEYVFDRYLKYEPDIAMVSYGEGLSESCWVKNIVKV